MPRSNEPRRPVGRPPLTSRKQILAAARGLIDEYGWEKLTIRRLSAEIGVAPTTLYSHVRAKDDLLFLLIHEYAEQIPHPEMPSEPRERIITAGVAIHDGLAAWPWAAEVLTTDGFIARLGDSFLSLVEAVLAGVVDAGCTPEQSVQIFRSIWYYTVGEILVRTHTRHREMDERDPAGLNAYFGNTDSPARLPHLAAIADRWGALAGQDTFAQGLRAFVDGLLAQALETSGTPKTSDAEPN
ncbi:TetR/AcrR family transcriptional regulator [Streptomyces sp. NBC_01283]|uniref:TetR/AcrR family transcriptional regulator n=1 Tax=Streptomyces sp. NBC_01283 TaxID=2903812 RepID=UPI00352BFDB5|nr:TetR/AcrR family transcriptional regulator [Streptomyces sp. NBC_01283]WSL21341.1 TetR/AcrR family transcriptional regulator [Streptomyces sp. NBC_01283]